MTDKKKIRAEIERLKNIADKNSFKWNDSARAAWRQQSWVCGEIISFIDSLPEENGRTLFEEIAYPGLNPTPKIPAYCTGVKGDPGPAGTSAWEVGIDAEIVKDIHNFLHVKSGPLPMPSEYKFGDKVKIIIVREDKQ